MKFLILLFVGLTPLVAGPNKQRPGTPDAAGYPADVVTSWLTMQLKISLVLGR